MNAKINAPNFALPVECRSRGMADNSLVIMDAEHNELCQIRAREDRHYGPENDRDIAVATEITRVINAHAKLVSACRDALNHGLVERNRGGYFSLAVEKSLIAALAEETEAQ